MAAQSSSSTRGLEDARQAYGRLDWVAARDGFRAAAEVGALSADDLAALADSAWWLGYNDEALAGFEEVFGRYVSGGRLPSAAKLALDSS